MTTRRGEREPGEEAEATEPQDEANPEASEATESPADASAEGSPASPSAPPSAPSSAPAPAAPAPEQDGDEPADAATDERRSRDARWWDAGGTPYTVAYWGSLLLLVAGLFRNKLLPFVDYPQHLALAGTLKRMIVGGGPERHLFETNLASYNSLFHVLVAVANLAVPIDFAGKLVLSLYVFLVGYATLALLRATGRPRARAFLILPVVFGYSIIWGFVNFGLGVSLQIVVLSRVLDRDRLLAAAHHHRGIRRYLPEIVTAVVALLGAYTHLLATALGYMLMLVAIVARAQTDRAPFFERFGRALRTGLPLLPAIGWCAFVYWRQTHGSFQNFEYGVAEGNDVFAMSKVKEFFTYATGFRADGFDAKVLSIGIGLLAVGAMLRDVEDAPPVALRWLFVASVVAYLIIPHVFWATNFVFERITFLIVLTAILWTPRAIPRYEQGLRLMYVSVGLAAAGGFFQFMGSPDMQKELGDLDAILDKMPDGRHVTGLLWDPIVRTHLPPPEAHAAERIQVTAQYSLLHTSAYYVARHGGEVAFSFTRTMSLPVHYRKETMPPDPPPNFEWNPGDYRAQTPWAKYFDLVLMKTQWEDQIDPRASVWGSHASEVDVVAHQGKWWVFETKRVTEDPPVPVMPIDPELELGPEE
jgi:chitodextrinase